MASPPGPGLADAFARRLTEGDRLPYTLAIYAGGGVSPHCHLMISERQSDGIERPADQWFRLYNSRKPELGGALKTARMRNEHWSLEARALWNGLVKQALETRRPDDLHACRGHAARGPDAILTHGNIGRASAAWHHARRAWNALRRAWGR